MIAPAAEIRRQLAQQLRQRRYDLQLSQVDADALVGFADGLIAKWECGDRLPSLSSIAAWAEAYGMRLVIAHHFPPPLEQKSRENEAIAILTHRGCRLQLIDQPQITGQNRPIQSCTKNKQTA